MSDNPSTGSGGSGQASSGGGGHPTPKIKIKFPGSSDSVSGSPAPSPGLQPEGLQRSVSFSHDTSSTGRPGRRGLVLLSGGGEREPPYLQQEKDPAFEEHFILRLPQDSSALKQLHADVDSKKDPDIQIHFLDPRHARIQVYGEELVGRLVDLPTIIESQKSIDNRRFVKVADVTQMLVVEGTAEAANGPGKTYKVSSGAPGSRDKVGGGRGDDFMWPDGITPPLHQVRQRRFRKRLSKHTIEQVEDEVERLLLADALAEDVEYEVLEVEDDSGDDSDLDGGVYDADDMSRKSYDGDDNESLSTVGDSGGRRSRGGTGTPSDMMMSPSRDVEEDEYADEDEEDLARKLAQGFAELKEMDADEEGGSDGTEEGSTDEEGETEEEEEEDEEDGDETSIKRRALLQEMSSLTESIHRKEIDLSKATNPIVKRRFEDIISRLRVELASKKAQLEELTSP
ncbi:MAG: TAFII55 protein conserved region-domain-containing protein [Piptocephalis tieghemiana]|nr:MAG: TAFII55 protein conserved region-domain-containing protein [Piptocephalis tieghemiana]